MGTMPVHGSDDALLVGCTENVRRGGEMSWLVCLYVLSMLSSKSIDPMAIEQNVLLFKNQHLYHYRKWRVSDTHPGGSSSHALVYIACFCQMSPCYDTAMQWIQSLYCPRMSLHQLLACQPHPLQEKANVIVWAEECASFYEITLNIQVIKFLDE